MYMFCIDCILVLFNYGSVTSVSLNEVYHNIAFSCKCSESLMLQEEAFNVEVPRDCEEGQQDCTAMSCKWNIFTEQLLDVQNTHDHTSIFSFITFHFHGFNETLLLECALSLRQNNCVHFVFSECPQTKPQRAKERPGQTSTSTVGQSGREHWGESYRWKIG